MSILSQKNNIKFTYQHETRIDITKKQSLNSHFTAFTMMICNGITRNYYLQTLC